MKKTKVLLAIGVLLLCSQLEAKKYSCNAKSSKPGLSLVECTFELNVNEDDHKAEAIWNGKVSKSNLDPMDRNFAEFEFDAEIPIDAGVWETTTADGKKVWTGFIMPSEEAGICNVACLEVKEP